MSPPSVHVVFGAGQVGLPLAGLLASRGHAVRLVSRSGTAVPAAGSAAPPAIHPVAADASDAAACRDAMAGASVAYHCMNPRYEAAAWETQLPRIQENLVAAAGREGARLVVLDNLYAVGRTGGRPMDEATPDAPCSRKGEARARVAEALRAAHRRGDVRAVTGRASDFYGPGGLQTHFGERFWRRLLAGKGAEVLGNPDTLHSYHFLPDVAAGLAALGEAADDALGQAWILPCAAAGTTRDLVGRFAAALGRPVPVRRMPRPLRRLLGLLVPPLREVEEVLYQWDEPFVAADRRFRERFGLAPTSPEVAARETVAWARRSFG
jgi:nucleoside-diphosphate-sugar epimerase